MLYFLWIKFILLKYVHPTKATFRVDSCAVDSEGVFVCVCVGGGAACCCWQVIENQLCEHGEIMFSPLVLSLPLLRGGREKDLGLVQLIFQSVVYIWKLCEFVLSVIFPVN